MVQVLDQLETRHKRQFEEQDCPQAEQGHLQGVMVEQGYPHQRQGEKQKLSADTHDHWSRRSVPPCQVHRPEYADQGSTPQERP